MCAASRFLSSIMTSAIMLYYDDNEIKKVDHLRILVTKQLDSMDLSSLMMNKEDADVAIQLLSAAALRQSVCSAWKKNYSIYLFIFPIHFF